MKKNLVIIISLSIISTVSVLLGIFFWPNNQEHTKITNFIPSDALFILESKHMHQLIDKNGKNNTYVNFIFKNETGKELIQFDSIFQYLPAYKDNTITTSFSIHDLEGSFAGLFYLTFKNKKQLTENKKLLYNVLNGELKEKHIYENEKIEFLILRQNNVKLYLWNFGNTLIASTKQGLLNRSIHQFHAKKAIDSNQEFTTLRQTSGSNVEANIYINFNSKSSLYKLNSTNTLLTLFANLQGNASWGALDFIAKDSTLIFNGFSSYVKNNSQYMSVLSNQKSTKSSIDSLLPSDTYKAIHLNLNLPDSFKMDYNRYLHRNGLLIRQKQSYMHIDSVYRFNISQQIYNQFDKSLVVFQKLSPDKSNVENFMLLQLKSPQEIINQLEAGHFPSNIIHPADSVEVKTYTIPANDLSGIFFGSLFSSPTLINFTVWNNLLIGSESYRNTENYIKHIISKETLIQDNLWNEQAQHITNEYVLKLFIKNHLFALKTKQISDKKNSTYTCLQFAPDNKMLYTSLFFQCKPYKKAIIQNSIYSAPIILTKSWFKDHYVAFTDTSMLFFTPDGSLKWSYRTNEKTDDQITELDAFSNGKYQLLFASKNYIYLVDKNGKTIPPFPIRLNNSLSGQVSWIKFNGSPDGRIFAPTEKGIEVYSTKGLQIAGWKTPATNYPILDVVNCYNINGQDIVYFHNGHEWFFTTRQGELKAQWPRNLNLPAHPSIYVNSSNKKNPCFITTTSEGEFVVFNLNNKYTLHKNNNISSNHYFIPYKLNNIITYMIADNDKLIQFNSNFEKKHEQKLIGKIVEYPKIHNTSNNEIFISLLLEKLTICQFSVKTNTIKNINLDNPKMKYYPINSNEGQIVWVNSRKTIEKKSIKKEDL